MRLAISSSVSRLFPVLGGRRGTCGGSSGRQSRAGGTLSGASLSPAGLEALSPAGRSLFIAEALKAPSAVKSDERGLDERRSSQVYLVCDELFGRGAF